jgi:hypothetical protein
VLLLTDGMIVAMLVRSGVGPLLICGCPCVGTQRCDLGIFSENENI